MNEGAQRYRLAFGIFDSSEGVWRTLVTLLDDGFTLDQFCLFEAASSIATLRDPQGVTEVDRMRFAPLYENVERWPVTSNGGPVIVATSGSLLRDLLTVKGNGSARQGGARSFVDYISEIEGQLAASAVVLAIRSLSPVQQRRSTRALLDQSQHSVMSYDFTLVPAMVSASAPSL